MKILYYAGWTITRVISKLIFRIKISGWEHVPKTAGFIVATNHISYYDPPLVGSWLPREVYFLAKKELFKNKLFGAIISRTNALPVKRGVIDRNAIALCKQVIDDGYGITIFPEGTRSKTDSFLDPKPGIGMIAKTANCPILVGYVHGSNRLSRCFLGKERMSITFDTPITVEELQTIPADKNSYMRIAELVMDRIGQIKSRVTSVK